MKNKNTLLFGKFQDFDFLLGTRNDGWSDFLLDNGLSQPNEI